MRSKNWLEIKMALVCIQVVLLCFQIYLVNQKKPMSNLATFSLPAIIFLIMVLAFKATPNNQEEEVMKKTEPMKRADIKPCALCNQGVMHTGLPLLWKVSITRFGIDMGAVQRAAGMEMMMGGHVALANIMGPNEDLAKPIGNTLELLVCERCAVDKRLPIEAIAECAREDEPDDEEAGAIASGKGFGPTEV